MNDLKEMVKTYYTTQRFCKSFFARCTMSFHTFMTNMSPSQPPCVVHAATIKFLKVRDPLVHNRITLKSYRNMLTDISHASYSQIVWHLTTSLQTSLKVPIGMKYGKIWKHVQVWSVNVPKLNMLNVTPNHSPRQTKQERAQALITQDHLNSCHSLSMHIQQTIQSVFFDKQSRNTTRRTSTSKRLNKTQQITTITGRLIQIVRTSSSRYPDSKAYAARQKELLRSLITVKLLTS